MGVRISRHNLILAGALAAITLAIPPAADAPRAQGGRGAIQTPGGGRGPGAAPDASDPANASADLSPKPPVLPLTSGTSRPSASGCRPAIA